MTFDNNDDYVYDAKWHPTNPSLFTSADGLGNLDFWDLNKDIEVPTYRYAVGKNALNKLSWSGDGKKLAAGDISGKVSIFNVDKELSNSKGDDSLKFEKVINQAKNNKKGF
jgi:dynein intermediate chain